MKYFNRNAMGPKHFLSDILKYFNFEVLVKKLKIIFEFLIKV